MKKIALLFLYLLPITCYLLPAGAASESFSCGPGFVLVEKSKVDGINAYECQKLWCRDLENGKTMGDGNAPANGYKTTSGPIELCDAGSRCVECFGDRKWCAGETPGVWNPEYGAYTKGGADNAGYTSQLKGACYAWRLEKPTCAAGETAVVQGGEWRCAVSTGTATGTRASAIRRTAGTGIMRVIR